MSFWTNKVVLVTGGSAGLGLAIAEAFALAGARLAIVGRCGERLKDAQIGLDTLGRKSDCLAIVADVTHPQDAQRMVAETVARFGRLDVLVNCVGESMRGEALHTPPEEYLRLFETNFISLVRTTQAAAPHLIASRGHIVNIGSLASKCASRYLGGYPASKFAVAAFSQQLRLEVGPQGVHTLLVCPGPIARDDAGVRYAAQSSELPSGAQLPGGGVKLDGIRPKWLAAKIVRACERRRAELIVPWWARPLIAVAQLWPKLGDWIIKRSTQ